MNFKIYFRISNLYSWWYVLVKAGDHAIFRSFIVHTSPFYANHCLMMEDNWLIICERPPTTNKLLWLALFSHLSSEPARPGSRGYWARDISPHCCHRDQIRVEQISVHRAERPLWQGLGNTRKCGGDFSHKTYLHFEQFTWMDTKFIRRNLNFYTNPITHPSPLEVWTGTRPSHRCWKLVNNNIAKFYKSNLILHGARGASRGPHSWGSGLPHTEADKVNADLPSLPVNTHMGPPCMEP